jgi:hypothetical protein
MEKAKDRPLFSELRFQRLVAASLKENDDDFDTQMRRAVQHVQAKKGMEIRNGKETMKSVNPIIVADYIFHRYRCLQDPAKIKAEHQFGFLFSNKYYSELLTLSAI